MSVAADLLAAVPPDKGSRAAPSAVKYLPADGVIAGLLKVDASQVYTTGSSKPGNVGVRARQSIRAANARYLVLVVEDVSPVIMEQTVTAASKLVGPGQKRAALLVAESVAGAGDWQVRAVIERAGGPVLAAVAAVWPGVPLYEPAPPTSVGPGSTFVVPLTVDPATGRMARVAIASSPAVLLVGPPGTGKNRLLSQILDEIALDPSSYGFKKAHEVVVEPAEEGWTTRDLVGGETVDPKGRLRFRPGRVLDAIANDRWLVIDEANRADLDRIFGGLLTWLSLQQVVVGRASTDVGAPLVRLGWTSQSASYVDGADRLEADDVGTEPIDYWAGSEFRLLGTYNALDAQRVFRFGLALGRRFAQVPVPPASVEDFTKMMESTVVGISDTAVRQRVAAKMVGLYGAHYAGAALGPAMFLSIPEYVSRGLALGELVDIDPSKAADIDRLVVEAYLLSTGSWLTRLDDHTELPELAARLTGPPAGGGSEPVLTFDEWDWVAAQLPTIGG